MRTKTIHALPTTCYGINFRSRLEARVAIFLEEIGCNWSYEPEGYDLVLSGPYLPDFHVQDFPILNGEVVSFWLEVKPKDPSVDEINKLRELACMTNTTGFFALQSRKQMYDGRMKNLDLFRHMVHEWHRPIDLNIGEDRGGKFFDLSRGVFAREQVPTSRFIPERPRVLGESLITLRGEEREEFFDSFDDNTLCWARVDTELAGKAAAKALSARWGHGSSGPC